MIYTTRLQKGGVGVQTIAPLDARIVKATFTSKIKDYHTTHSDIILDAYNHLALSGTKSMTETEIDAYIRKHGIVLTVSASAGFVHYQVTAQKKTFKKCATLIEELVFNPKFKLGDVTKTKRLMLEENREMHDSTKHIAEMQFMNLLYPKKSFLSWDTLEMQKKQVSKIDEPKLRTLMKAIQGGEWYISIVGTPDTAKSIGSTLKRFEASATMVSRVFKEPAIPKKQTHFTTIPGKTNVEVRIGNRLPFTPSDAEYLPFVFGLSVLGKVGGFTGRLMSTIREKEGLTYGIYAKASYINTLSTGHWNVFTFFSGKDLEKGIKATLREITRIKTKGITERELKVFKEILHNQFLIGHESNARRLTLYHRAFLHGEDEMKLIEDVENMHELKIDEINAALKAHLHPESLIISCAGPVTQEGAGITS